MAGLIAAGVWTRFNPAPECLLSSTDSACILSEAVWFCEPISIGWGKCGGLADPGIAGPSRRILLF